MLARILLRLVESCHAPRPVLRATTVQLARQHQCVNVGTRLCIALLARAVRSQWVTGITQVAAATSLHARIARCAPALLGTMDLRPTVPVMVWCMCAHQACMATRAGCQHRYVLVAAMLATIVCQAHHQGVRQHVVL